MFVLVSFIRFKKRTVLQPVLSSIIIIITVGSCLLLQLNSVPVCNVINGREIVENEALFDLRHQL